MSVSSDAGKKSVIWLLGSNLPEQALYAEILGEGFGLRFFPTLASFDSALASEAERPALIVADLAIQDGDFLEIAAARGLAAWAHVPFVIVSATDDEKTMRSSFAYGAVDYLTKPVGRAELLCKIERHVEGHSQEGLCSDRLLARYGLIPPQRNARITPLTHKEHQIIAMLFKATEQTISRPELMWRVWGGAKAQNKTLDVHLHNLRKKIAPIGLKIQFVAPDRYRLQRETVLPSARLSLRPDTGSG